MSINNFQLTLTTQTGITEVNQGQPETITQRLNRLAKEAGFNNISPNAIEIIGWNDEETATTLTFNRDMNEPFTLVHPIAGRIRLYNKPGLYQVPSDYVGTVGIHRAYIGYMTASQINNVLDMKTTLQPIINLGIMDFINQVGTLGLEYKISMQRPGYEEIYFRETEDSAAYEIRLILTKE